jgi:hypothetical protein
MPLGHAAPFHAGNRLGNAHRGHRGCRACSAAASGSPSLRARVELALPAARKSCARSCQATLAHRHVYWRPLAQRPGPRGPSARQRYAPALHGVVQARGKHQLRPSSADAHGQSEGSHRPWARAPRYTMRRSPYRALYGRRNRRGLRHLPLDYYHFIIYRCRVVREAMKRGGTATRGGSTEPAPCGCGLKGKRYAWTPAYGAAHGDANAL